MKQSEVTCGPLFLKARDLFTTVYTTEFEAGFCIGLCEKVHLGACSAAMMRPEQEHFEWAIGIAQKVADVYNLKIRIYEYWVGIDLKREIWILRNHWAVTLFNGMQAHAVNSPAWHTERGRLCGVPNVEIDPMFHERIMGAT